MQLHNDNNALKTAPQPAILQSSLRNDVRSWIAKPRQDVGSPFSDISNRCFPHNGGTHGSSSSSTSSSVSGPAAGSTLGGSGKPQRQQLKLGALQMLPAGPPPATDASPHKGSHVPPPPALLQILEKQGLASNKMSLPAATSGASSSSSSQPSLQSQPTVRFDLPAQDKENLLSDVSSGAGLTVTAANGRSRSLRSSEAIVPPPPPPPTLIGDSGTLESNSHLSVLQQQQRCVLTKYHYLKNFTVKPKTPNSKTKKPREGGGGGGESGSNAQQQQQQPIRRNEVSSPLPIAAPRTFTRSVVVATNINNPTTTSAVPSGSVAGTLPQRSNAVQKLDIAPPQPSLDQPVPSSGAASSLDPLHAVTLKNLLPSLQATAAASATVVTPQRVARNLMDDLGNVTPTPQQYSVSHHHHRQPQEEGDEGESSSVTHHFCPRRDYDVLEHLEEQELILDPHETLHMAQRERRWGDDVEEDPADRTVAAECIYLLHHDDNGAPSLLSEAGQGGRSSGGEDAEPPLLLVTTADRQQRPPPQSSPTSSQRLPSGPHDMTASSATSGGGTVYQTSAGSPNSIASTAEGEIELHFDDEDEEEEDDNVLNEVVSPMSASPSPDQQHPQQHQEATVTTSGPYFMTSSVIGDGRSPEDEEEENEEEEDDDDQNPIDSILSFFGIGSTWKKYSEQRQGPSCDKAVQLLETMFANSYKKHVEVALSYWHKVMVERPLMVLLEAQGRRIVAMQRDLSVRMMIELFVETAPKLTCRTPAAKARSSNPRGGGRRSYVAQGGDDAPMPPPPPPPQRQTESFDSLQ